MNKHPLQFDDETTPIRTPDYKPYAVCLTSTGLILFMATVWQILKLMHWRQYGDKQKLKSWQKGARRRVRILLAKVQSIYRIPMEIQKRLKKG